MLSCVDRMFSKYTSDSRISCLLVASLYSTYLRMRIDNPAEIMCVRKYFRRKERFLSNFQLSCRNCVIEAVRLERKDEKTSKAKMRTPTAKARSWVFRGTISIEAGVNCVRLQCSADRYLYEKSFSISKLLCLTHESTSSVVHMPTPYHEQAMMWFMPSTKKVPLAIPMRMWKCSESMWSISVSINFCSFTSRNRRSERTTRMTRRDFPMRAIAGARPSSPNQATKSEATTSRSKANQVFM
mmetsp:Transcript_135738/g.338618  ORF Transcript_135738/g.338618 Transcript_135738/m.338618 type:complete len:241 (-) Transcript_135738:367-1089(-)